MRRNLSILLIAGICLASGLAEGASPESGRLRVGLALSGGGAKGLAHIGVLKVLEEEGVPVDRISGTSMGAIIGGLYSLGYDAETLERVIKQQDWTSLLLDHVPRRALSMDEKESDGKYIGTFPLTKGRISLPKGLVAGQQITLMLTRLTIPFHHVTDFGKLPIPFMCMATDIETGQPVILDNGFLPEAMRASMSIPFIFNPVEIDGRLLVDGGIVRNLPVSDARNMGADIVIGVDVGSTLYTKEQLNSLTTIMDQCVSFMKDASTREQQELCDILITPDIDESHAFAFDAVGELVKQGEEAARKKLPQIRELARQIAAKGRNPGPEPKQPFNYRRKLAVKSLGFEGLNKVSEHLLRGKLRLRVPGRYTIKQIEQAIDRAYGTRFFERLTYIIKPGQDGVHLVIKVVEQTTHLFNIGARYDSDQKAAFLLNNTFRNTIFQGSKLTLDARLGSNLMLKGAFFVHTGWKPGVGCGVSLEGSRYDTFTYQNNKRSAHYELRSLTGDMTLQTIFSNSLIIGGGIRKEFTTVKPIISPDGEVKRDNEYLNFLGFLKIDTLDRAVYPRRGGRFYSELKATTDWLTANAGNKRETFERAYVSYRKAIPLNRRTTFLGHYFLGSIEGEKIPEEHLFYFGGLHEQVKCDFPFIGYDYMQIAGKHAQGLQVGLQFEIKPEKFLTLRSNIGKIAETRDEVFNHNDLFYGHGLTLGQNTIIGPMELTVMNSSDDDNLAGYLNVGYIF